MKIAVNTRLLLKNKLEGIGWFTFETLKRITQQHPEHEFIFIFDRPYSDEFIFSDNITPVVIGPQARHPFLFYLWFEFSVTKILKKYNVDIFLSPDGYISLRTKVPTINVIHDINFEHYPQYLPFMMRKYYRYYFPRFARKAKRVATVSEYSKQDIAKQYGIDTNKIDVTYNGANESFKPVDENIKIATKKQYSSSFPYFLFVGSLHPRKNIENLFKAFDLFKQKTDNDFKLLIVGEKYWWNGKMQNTYNNLKFKDEIIFTGRMNSDELKNVYASAFALTYVSIFEGFGIPILEAMYCDVPVITSNTTSMPEVGGDAVLYADPFSILSICDAMEKLFFDNEIRIQLIEKGKERCNMFNWQKTADKLWNSVERLIKEVNP